MEEFIADWDTPVDDIEAAEEAGKRVVYPAGSFLSRLPEVWRSGAARQLGELGFVVELRPGLAVINRSDSDVTVELEYKGRTGKGWTIRDLVTAARISGEIPDQLDLGPYFDAFALKLISEPRAKTLRAPRSRPEPGQPFDVDFYTRVIALHNRFSDEGRSDPSAAVAELMGERPETVRLWVHRGRKWFREHEEDR